MEWKLLFCGAQAKQGFLGEGVLATPVFTGVFRAPKESRDKSAEEIRITGKVGKHRMTGADNVTSY